MAVKIRLARHGAKKRPFYRVVATDEHNPRDGSFIEQLGTYDPNSDPAKLNLNIERVDYWLGVGAVPSGTVHNLINRYRREAVQEA